MNKVIYISIIIISIFSCRKPEDRQCYKSTGKTISEFRDLENFSVIVLNDNIELVLNQSADNNTTISSGENLINFIKTDISGDTLYISNENKCNNLRSNKHSITVNVNVKYLTRIEHNGTKGLRFSNTIKSDSLAIESIDGHGDVSINFEGKYLATIFHSGTCNVTATGVVEESFAYQISNGYTDYSNLSAKKCHLHSRTIQDCTMNADEIFSVNIQGAGNVYYKDNTNLIVEKKGNGSGELISQ